MSPDLKLRAFAQFLCDRREQITREWIDAVRTDPGIPASTKLPHEALSDHLPALFDDLAETLGSSAAPRARSAAHAQAHGEHRWWQGFQFTELLREMSILRRIISVQHLAGFALENPDWPHEARREAEMQVHTFFDRIFRESAREFVEKTEAERVQFRSLFESTAGAYVVLKPATFEVVAVSDAYLRATSMTRDAIMGRCLFDVFPVVVGDSPTEAIANMRSSIERVMTHRSRKAAEKRSATGVPSTRPCSVRMARSPSLSIGPRM